MGGEWFLNNQNDSFLYYRYYPYENRHSTKHHSLREMGALWSIAKLSNFLNDSRYDSLAQKGFRYFEDSFKYDEEDDFYCVNITRNKIKLGYSAFIILTLLEIDHPKKEYYLDKFAQGIINMQNKNGSLNTFFYSNRSSGTDYYPGEALFALISLYEYKNDKRFLEVVENAFPYYVEYWRNRPNTAFVPWQTRAYYQLYKITQKRKFANFVFEMNDYMLERHSPKKQFSDFNFSRGIVTAVYLEGVIKAYELARELNDNKRTKCYANFIKEGLDFIITLQIADSTNFTKEALGGFLGSQKSKSMRADRNQHAVMALMEACEIGIIED